MILFVCTGNTCRSPLGEALLRAKLDAAGDPTPVASAGTLGWNDKPPTPHVLEVLGERDVAFEGHVSRKIDRDMIGQADLIIAMTRTHAWAAAAHEEAARERTFLPGELARLGGFVGPRGVGEPLSDWVRRVANTRGGHMIAGRVQDEIADPAGEPIDVYRRVADRLDAILDRVVPLIAAGGATT